MSCINCERSTPIANKTNHNRFCLIKRNCVFANLQSNAFYDQFFWQQILFHLSQITPRTHTIRLKESKSNRKSNKIAQNEYEVLCQQSLWEAVRNFQASTNTSILELPLSAVMRQKPLAGSQTKTNSAIRSLNRLENTIKMSYVSKDTFQENRAEPKPDALTTTSTTSTSIPIVSHPNTFLLATNLIHQLSQPIFRSAIQIRGFRTQRNIESQLKRNPTFLSRIQQAFGMFTETHLPNNCIYFGI